MMDAQPGQVVLLGSGETSPNIRKVYDRLFNRLETPIKAAILETPAGFEPNSAAVAGQIGAYLEKHLQNYQPQISIVPARKKDTAFSTDDPEILTPFYDADVLITGPGSPTYAVRQLQDSVAWHTLQACHRLGTTLIFSSATTLACSLYTMPVYEIYKVGEDLHWKKGLNFFAPFGLTLVFVPHWNNNDGGDELDTSRCYLGQERFAHMVKQLKDRARGDSSEFIIVGIDENTALVVDPARACCRVMGQGNVTIVRNGSETVFASGDTFSAQELGSFHLPPKERGIPAEIWTRVEQEMMEARERAESADAPPNAVISMVNEREAARRQKDWARSDTLRDQIETTGWSVRDTREGPVLEPIES